ncbi:hypothetical protein AAG906_000816 [Vitis piasezkii]
MRPLTSHLHSTSSSPSPLFFFTSSFTPSYLHPFTYLFRLLSAAPTSVLSCAWCVLLLLYSTRPRPVLLLNYACFKPESHRRCTLEVSEYFLRRSHSFRRVKPSCGIYLKSGLGDETYAPKFFEESCEPKFECAVDEAREGMFSAIDALLQDPDRRVESTWSSSPPVVSSPSLSSS